MKTIPLTKEKEYYCSDCFQIFGEESLGAYGDHIVDCGLGRECKNADHWELDSLGHETCEEGGESTATELHKESYEIRHLLDVIRQEKEEQHKLFNQLTEVCTHPKKNGHRCSYCFKVVKGA